MDQHLARSFCRLGTTRSDPNRAQPLSRVIFGSTSGMVYQPRGHDCFLILSLEISILLDIVSSNPKNFEA